MLTPSSLQHELCRLNQPYVPLLSHSLRLLSHVVSKLYAMVVGKSCTACKSGFREVFDWNWIQSRKNKFIFSIAFQRPKEDRWLSANIFKLTSGTWQSLQPLLPRYWDLSSFCMRILATQFRKTSDLFDIKWWTSQYLMENPGIQLKYFHI